MRYKELAKVATCALGLYGFAVGDGLAQNQARVAAPPVTRQRADTQTNPLDPGLIYKGWRARLLFGQPVMDRHADQQIGTVRDILVDANGQAAALVIENSGTEYVPQAIYRIRWKDVDLTPYRSGVVIDPPSRDLHRFGLFPGSESVDTLPREFRLSEILGDYARLQTGYGYGIVTDAIFTQDGQLRAVLVSRDAASGGRTIAFPFLGTQGPWDPGLSYYGLPFVTDHQADSAGLKVDPDRFNDAAL